MNARGLVLLMANPAEEEEQFSQLQSYLPQVSIEGASLTLSHLPGEYPETRRPLVGQESHKLVSRLPGPREIPPPCAPPVLSPWISEEILDVGIQECPPSFQGQKLPCTFM